MSNLALALALGQTFVGLAGSRQQARAEQAQFGHNSQIALWNYMRSMEDREMAVASRELTRLYQVSASNAERFRAQREATMARVSQGFRQQDRSAEVESVRLDALERQGQAQAAAGAAGVSGISVAALQRAYEVTAGRIVGQIQAEERRDAKTTKLNIEDIFLRSANELIRINQPLDGVGGVAPLLTPVRPSSAGMWANMLSSVVGGLQTFGSMGGEFPWATE